jgi:hypothetical protein
MAGDQFGLGVGPVLQVTDLRGEILQIKLPAAQGFFLE